MKKNRKIGRINADWLGKLHALMRHGFTVPEAAEQMNVSEGAVTKYYRILRKIEAREPVEERSNYCKSAVREYCQTQNLKLFEEAVGKDLEPDGDEHNSEENWAEKAKIEILFSDGSVRLYGLFDVQFVEEKDFHNFGALLNEVGTGITFVCTNKIQTVTVVEG